MKKLLLLFFSLISFAVSAGNFNTNIEREANAKEWINKQALEFIENKGQFANSDGKVADNVLFKASYGNCDIYITDKGLSYIFKKIEKDSFQKFANRKGKFDFFKTKIEKRNEENNKLFYYRLDLNLQGADIIKTNVIKEEESQQGHYNYFYPHCPQGIYDVKGYGKITIKNIYKGIDWVIYTNPTSKQHPLKYDFIVHQGADFKNIKIKFLNAQNISLYENDSKLKIETIAGIIEEGNLHSFFKGSQNEVQSKYKILADSTICFEIANYDITKTLIIDPLVWATYYGGGADEFFTSICVDTNDNVYITGGTGSSDFPLLQVSGAYMQSSLPLWMDIFIIKFNKKGQRIWASFYGGSDDDFANSICVDKNNSIYITGSACSYNLPLKQLSGAYWQPGNNSQAISTHQTTYILKFDSSGVRKWATYYGGDGQEYSNSISVDHQNNLYLTGLTTSYYFPVQQLAGAFWQSSLSCGIGTPFILKFDSLGTRKWATYYGGTWTSELISSCIDKNNNFYITGYADCSDFPTQQMPGAYWQPIAHGGSNIILIKFNSSGNCLWSTFVGDGYGVNQGYSICLDSKENILITGITNSTNFPVIQPGSTFVQSSLGGLMDIFLLKFNKLGVMQWSTYYGGNDNDYGYSIKTDKNDNIYVAGSSYSYNFPLQQMNNEYFQSVNYSYESSVFLKFTNQGYRKWATYYGGDIYNEARGIAVDNQNDAYFVGSSFDTTLYTKDYNNGAYYDSTNNGSLDGYVIKIHSSCHNVKPSFIESNKSSFCQNDTGYIHLNVIGGYGDTLVWFLQACGQQIIGKGNPLIIPVPSQTTSYYARWQSSCDTSDCESIEIKINKPPIINLGPDISICENQHLLLNVSANNAINLWQDSSVSPTFNVSSPGLYWVKVSIDSCSAMDSINISMDDCEIKLEMPNFFSPNNDGINDFFTPIIIKGITELKTTIYNRWGNLIFTSEDLKINWDGKTNKGEKVADGIYYWIVEYKDIKNIQSGKHGSVTIMN
ncbi:MAG: SBBP repeat-containing protein [Bacteroidota bacterium]